MLLLLLAFVSCAEAENYCVRGLCPKGTSHIACNNKGVSVGRKVEFKLWSYTIAMHIYKLF